MDEFWDIQIEKSKPKDSLTYLVPYDNFNEGIGLNLNNNSYPEKSNIFHSYKTYIDCNNDNDNNDNDIIHKITIREIRGYGILDTIGGELWEASFLLSSYILLDYKKDKKWDSRVLEIGTGCGLPSLLLTELMKTYNNRNNDMRTVTLTDNDTEVLNNLRNLLIDSYENINNNNNNNNNNDIIIELEHLDWSNYQYIVDDKSGNISIDKQDLNISNENFDIIIGAACVYSPLHIYLADTIKYFLSGNCKEVIIVQIGDRPGMEQFINRLKLLNINFIIEEVPEHIYNYTNNIHVETSIQNTLLELGTEEILVTKKITFNHTNITNNNTKVLTTSRNHFVILKAFK